MYNCRKCNIESNIFLQKVLGFAAFFSLVLKKVEQEEYGDPQLEDARRTSGTLVVSENQLLFLLIEVNTLGAIINLIIIISNI